MRALATDLAAFEIEQGCKSVGGEMLAGRTTQVYSFATDLGRGEARVKLWVETASGLPIKTLSDEPDFDVETVFEKSKGKGAPKVTVDQKANGKCIVSTHAYVYGDSVKPPSRAGQVDTKA